MNFKESLGWNGKVYITKKNIKTKEIISQKLYYNMIMNEALNELIKSVYSTANMDLKYLGIGTGSTAVTSSDTQLDTEVYRIPIITQYVSGTGQVTSRAILLDSEPWTAIPPPTGYQLDITEIGFFGGVNATTILNSGLLVSRIVLTTPEQKLDNEQITFTRIDSINRA